MPDFSFTEKAWKDACPASLSKDKSVGDAIGKVLKVVPAGSIGRIKTLADCKEAVEACETLASAVAKMAAAVGKAKDDKKGAAALLAKWGKELKDAEDDITARQADLCEAVTKPVVSKYGNVFLTMEPHVKAVLVILKKIENQMGHSEQMRQEAYISIANRAIGLTKTGHPGKELEDFMNDPEIKTDYKVWEEQIDLYVTSVKKLEEQIDARKTFMTMSKEMRKAIDEAAKEIEGYAVASSKPQKAFEELDEGLAKLMKAITGGKYINFDLIMPHNDSASEVRAAEEKILRDRLKKIDPKAAEDYWANGLAKRGLDERLMKRTVKVAGALLDEVGTVVDGMGKKTVSLEDGVERLQEISDELAEIHATHVKACSDMTVIQALSKDINAKAKERIQEAGEQYELAKDLAAKALVKAKAAQKAQGNPRIGGHRPGA